MASELAIKKAVEVAEEWTNEATTKTLRELIAAALDEARAEGEKRGAERERGINHKQAATQADEHHRADNHNEAKAVGVVRDLIAARGPMRGPEEE